MKTRIFIRPGLLALLLGVAALSSAPAATIVWSGASGTDTNWSNGNNWAGTVAPGGGDDVKFYDAGTNLTLGLPNSFVDGVFAGYVGSLQLGNTNGMHTLALAPGQTLSLTNGNLTAGTSGDPGAARNFTNTITGAGATLFVSNLTANISINQCTASGSPNRANLDLSGLDNFVVSANRLGIGDGQFPGVPINQRAGGNLILAKTNVITLAYADTLANYQTAGKNFAINMSRNSGNNPGIISLLQLGLVNTFNLDSLDIGMDKSGNNSSPAHGVMNFNPVWAGQHPTASFYGAGGPGTRVTWWGVGDGNSSASSSNGGGGTNDFSLGTVNIWVNVMSLARDAASSNDTWAGPHKGVFTFTNGTVDANTLIIGNQSLETGTSTAPSLGIFNVAGAGALLRVNTAMTLGMATLGTAAGTKTLGLLNVTNGTVLANNITVGVNSSSNTINLINGTLIVTNTIATNQSGLFALNISNATLGLSVSASGSLRVLARTLNTTGPANLIQLDPAPVIFSAYPQQFPLLKYTAWTGSNTFALVSIPAWAPGATLVSNGPNKSLDLLLPTDPRPVITNSFSQPVATPPYPNPGDTVTLSVGLSPNSVLPAGYQWYLGATPLADGLTVNGSTLSGSTTNTLTIANSQTNDSGNYTIVITNIYGAITSSPLALIVSTNPAAPTVAGPAAVTVIQGNPVSLANLVAGKPAPGLQWQFNGTNLTDGAGPSGSSTLAGSSTATLVLGNAQYPGDQGTYSLIASNSAGWGTNNTVVTVIVPPGISAQPQNLVVTNSQSASFAVAATGVPNPAYQWYYNNQPISGALNATATTATLAIASASPTNSGNFYVKISNAAGTTNSASASLTVNSASLAPAVLVPASGATGICYDTPLYLTFNQPIAQVNVGTIRIYNVTNPATPVDTLDMSLNLTLQTPYAVNVQPRNIGGDTFNNFPVIITGNKAAIYPHLGVLTSNQTYYVTVDDGVFMDAGGAYFMGLSATNAWQFTTKAGGPANPTNLVVAADGSGDFVTVQGAVDSVPANNTTPTVINLRNGFYQEIVDVKSKHNLDFRGQSRNGALIGYPNNNNVNASGAPLRAMFVLNGNDCTFETLTITNTTPAGGSQAEAIDVEGTRATFYNIELDSYQDTFLVHSAGKLVYFQDSLIQGQTDFNWGYGTVYYTNCEIRCLLSGGHVTQPRSPYTTNGFGFINCRITATNSADLGRTIGTPTSPSEVLYYNCLISDFITGYTSDAGTNMADYNCSNLTATASKTLTFSTHAPSSDPFVIAIQSASTWLYGWTPQLAPNILTNPAGQSVSAGQSTSFTVSATGIPAPGYQWLQNGLPLASATNATFAIASTVRTNGGNYSVVVSNGSGSVTSSVAALTYNNTAPVAGNTSYTRYAGVSLHITISELLTNVTDVDGDPITLVGVSLSTNGVILVNDGSNLLYQNASNVNDQFTYTVADGFGGTNSGLVNIVISTNSVFGQTSPAISTTNGAPVMEFAGIPGYSYSVARTTNVVDAASWIVIWTTNAPLGGLFQFIDTSAPEPTAFYRLQYNP